MREFRFQVVFFVVRIDRDVERMWERPWKTATLDKIKRENTDVTGGLLMASLLVLSRSGPMPERSDVLCVVLVLLARRTLAVEPVEVEHATSGHAPCAMQESSISPFDPRVVEPADSCGQRSQGFQPFARLCRR